MGIPDLTSVCRLACSRFAVFAKLVRGAIHETTGVYDTQVSQQHPKHASRSLTGRLQADTCGLHNTSEARMYMYVQAIIRHVAHHLRQCTATIVMDHHSLGAPMVFWRRCGPSRKSPTCLKPSQSTNSFVACNAMETWTCSTHQSDHCC